MIDDAWPDCGATTSVGTPVVADGSQKLRSLASGERNTTVFGVAQAGRSRRTAISQNRAASAATSSGAAPRPRAPAQYAVTPKAAVHQPAAALAAKSGHSGAGAPRLASAAIFGRPPRAATSDVSSSGVARNAGTEGPFDVPIADGPAGRAGRPDAPAGAGAAPCSANEPRARERVLRRAGPRSGRADDSFATRPVVAVLTTRPGTLPIESRTISRKPRRRGGCYASRRVHRKS